MIGRFSDTVAMPDRDAIHTPDGRYIVIDGKLWRASNPELSPEVMRNLVDQLMTARQAVAAALKADDAQAENDARSAVNNAKIALGERGPVWWTDGQPDFNRRLVSNTPYADWFASLRSGPAT